MADGTGASWLACGMRSTESRVGELSAFPPKFHPDNNRKAYLTCMALKYLPIKGQVLGLRSYLSRTKFNFGGHVVSKTKEKVHGFSSNSCFIFKEHRRPFERLFKEWVWKGVWGKEIPAECF